MNSRHNDSGSGSPQFDLEERTACFGEATAKFARTIPQNAVNNPLINQLLRAGTIVSGNYCEADDAVSKKEFRCKIGTGKKEARATKHWLRMIVAAEPDKKIEARTLWREAKELHLIFAAIFRK
ncbi:MAG: four helix bundle protein [Verrucomicrobia bacterium]|nr:four helix bundle protein [Verrucomicrobiota bacterium]